MPYGTTSAGDAQRQGRFMVAAGATSGLPGLLKSQTINAAGTRSTRNFWLSSEGRLRWVSGSEPTNELTSGTDITASLPSGTVTPTMASNAINQTPIVIPIEALAANADVSNRGVFYSGTLTMSSNTGYILNTGEISASATNPTTIGIGTTAAHNVLYRSFTSTVAAGTVSTLTAGSVTSIAAQQRIRMDITQGGALATFPSGGIIVWHPRKT